VLIRSAWFTLAAIVLIAAWDLFTFELLRESGSEVWKHRLLMHVFLLLHVILGAIVGALLGFSYFPPNRTLTSWRLAALGGVFALVMFFAAAPLAWSGSFVAVFVGSLLLAAMLAQIGGRILATSAA